MATRPESPQHLPSPLHATRLRRFTVVTAFASCVALGAGLTRDAREAHGQGPKDSASKKTKASDQIITVDEIEPGMKGYAVTVFFGDKSDRFDIEVVDVIHDYLPDQDAVLFKSDDPRLEHSGIVGGMSGSPIYIEGRLAGALAYGYPFGKDPLGGMTPIEEMLDVGKLPYRPEVFRNPGRPRAAGRSGTAAWADAMLGLGTSPLPQRKRPEETTATGLEPLAVPMSVAGFGPKTTAFLADATGLVPVRGGSGKGGDTKDGKAKPRKWAGGDSVSIVLAAGDNAIAANGTVTWVGGKKGERMVAFGHPMYDSGPSKLPMADARVHTILASVQRSFKISSPGTVQGTMIQDRQAAISLRTDIAPTLIPVHTEIQGADPGLGPRVYENEVAELDFLTPAMVSALLMQGVEEAAPDAVEVMVEMKHEVSVVTQKGPRTFVLEEDIYFPSGVIRPLIANTRAIILIAAAMDNDLEIVKIRSVKQTAKVSYGAEVETIEEIRLGRGEIRAGEVAEFEVSFKTPLGDTRTETVALRIPDDAGGEEIVVDFSGGDYVRPYRPIPETVDDLLETIALKYPSRSLVASVFRSAEGLSTEGALLSDVPDSVLESLSVGGGSKKSVRFKQMARRVLKTPTIVEGSEHLKVSVLPKKRI